MIYVIQGQMGGEVKIGYTAASSVTSRVGAIERKEGRKMRVLRSMEGTKAHEAALHDRFKEHRISGEWFAPHPDLMAAIPSIDLDSLEVGGSDKTTILPTPPDIREGVQALADKTGLPFKAQILVMLRKVLAQEKKR